MNVITFGAFRSALYASASSDFLYSKGVSTVFSLRSSAKKSAPSSCITHCPQNRSDYREMSSSLSDLITPDPNKSHSKNSGKQTAIVLRRAAYSFKTRLANEPKAAPSATIKTLDSACSSSHLSTLALEPAFSQTTPGPTNRSRRKCLRKRGKPRCPEEKRPSPQKLELRRNRFKGKDEGRNIKFIRKYQTGRTRIIASQSPESPFISHIIRPTFSTLPPRSLIAPPYDPIIQTAKTAFDRILRCISLYGIISLRRVRRDLPWQQQE